MKSLLKVLIGILALSVSVMLFSRGATLPGFILGAMSIGIITAR